MQIFITGPRGCGKTTVAMELAKFLRERGCKVRIRGDDDWHSNELLENSLLPPDAESMYLPIAVTIVDISDDAEESDMFFLRDKEAREKLGEPKLNEISYLRVMKSWKWRSWFGIR